MTTLKKIASHIYRLALERRYPDRSSMYAIVPQSIGQAVQRENPEVQECIRLFDLPITGIFYFA